MNPAPVRIEIATADGPRLISADEIPGTDGILAVHMTVGDARTGGAFSVSHVPTARLIATAATRALAIDLGARVWAQLSAKQRQAWRATSVEAVRRATPKTVRSLVEGSAEAA